MNYLVPSFLFHIYDVDSVRFGSDWRLLPQAQVSFDYTSEGIISYLMQMESYSVFKSPPGRTIQIKICLLLRLFLLYLFTSWFFTSVFIMGCSKHGANPSVSINCGKFLD
jgi:hypothetical protein